MYVLHDTVYILCSTGFFWFT